MFSVGMGYYGKTIADMHDRANGSMGDCRRPVWMVGLRWCRESSSFALAVVKVAQFRSNAAGKISMKTVDAPTLVC